ncbi:MAG: hypothetical protein U0636_09080 [Phycisphaerales bacterium]
MKTKHTKATARKPASASVTRAAPRPAPSQDSRPAVRPAPSHAPNPATWLTSRVQPKPFPTTATARELSLEVRRVLDLCPTREWNELRRARPGRMSGNAPFICG